MKYRMRFVLSMLAAASLTVAADKPDFSGNWKMDAGQSDFGGGPPPDSLTRKVEQAGSSLILTDEQTSSTGHDKAVRKYTIDGAETTYQWMGNEVKSAAHWEGNAIVVVGKVNASGTDIVVTSRLTLSADGKKFTENDKLATGGNDIGGFQVVFVKQ